MFHTYIHVRNDTGKVFYVGKGLRARVRARSNRSTRWKRIVAKYGYKAEIVASFEREVDAFQHERELIKHYRAAGNELINLTDGGDGTSGWIQSAETIARRTETIKRPDVAKKISDALPKGSHHHAARRVICVDTGAEFDTIASAVRWLASIGIKKPSPAPICGACSGRFNRIYGYRWQYADSPAEYIDRKPKRPVTCEDTKMTFTSIQSALEWLRSNGHPKASSTAISSACSGKRPFAYGLRWKYVI